MPIPMLLAVDAGAIVAVIFGLISFIGWVMNQVNSSQKPTPPPRKRAPRDRTIQEEIDQFLSDREGKPRPNRRDEEILTPDQVELIDEPRRKPAPKPQPQQKPRPKPKQTPQKAASRPQPQRVSKPLASEQSTTTVTHPARQAAQLGREMQQQVSQAMAPRLATTVSKDLPHSVDQSVSQHLGQFSSSSQKSPAAVERHAVSIVSMLRNPNSVRGAIIVNEILSPPLSRRKK